MRISNGSLGALAGLICLLAAPGAAQQTIPGEDCSLCKAVARGERTALPEPGEGPEAYARNLRELSNCLDRALFTADRGNLKPLEGDKWQTAVRDAYGAGRWVDSLETPSSACADCMTDSEKLSAMYLVIFGREGSDSASLGVAEQARLSCQATHADLGAASTAVRRAAQ